MDITFFTLICCKNCIVCLNRPKIKEKEAGVGPFFKKRLKCAGPLCLTVGGMRHVNEIENDLIDLIHHGLGNRLR